MLSISLGGLGVGGGLPRWLVLTLWGGEPKAAIARQLAQTRVVTRRGDRTASARQGLLAHAPVIGWNVAAVARRATEIVVARETVCAHERRWRAHLKCDERVALRSAVLLKAPCGEPDARADDRRSRGSERQELVAPTVVVTSNLMPIFALARASSTSSAACTRATNAASCAAEGAAQGRPPVSPRQHGGDAARGRAIALGDDLGRRRSCCNKRTELRAFGLHSTHFFEIDCMKNSL